MSGSNSLMVKDTELCILKTEQLYTVDAIHFCTNGISDSMHLENQLLTEEAFFLAVTSSTGHIKA